MPHSPPRIAAGAEKKSVSGRNEPDTGSKIRFFSVFASRNGGGRHDVGVGQAAERILPKVAGLAVEQVMEQVAGQTLRQIAGVLQNRLRGWQQDKRLNKARDGFPTSREANTQQVTRLVAGRKFYGYIFSEIFRLPPAGIT